MALTAQQQWWVRTGGNELNGGGFDSTISGAGTNYADQDAPQLSLTDLTSTASTTVTSAAAGFTAQMVGNIIRLASATGSPVADSGGSRYLCIVAYVSATQVTVDKTSGTYTLGVARVGGAHAGLINYSNGGSATAPILTTPLAAGHTINMRGGGTNDPSSPDYTQTGYYQFPSGDQTSGSTRLIGYNGRPHLRGDGLTFYQLAFWEFQSIKLSVSAAGNGSFGVINASYVDLIDSKLDQNGFDVSLALGVAYARNTAFLNSGSTIGGSNPGVTLVYGGSLHGCWVNKIGCDGVQIILDHGGTLVNTLITNCERVGVYVAATTYLSRLSITNCTIAYNGNSGIYLDGAVSLSILGGENNILAFNGVYGIASAFGPPADQFQGKRFDYNDFYGNTSGARSNLVAGAHDLALDPQFTNASGGDFTIGTNLAAQGFPGTFPS